MDLTPPLLFSLLLFSSSCSPAGGHAHSVAPRWRRLRHRHGHACWSRRAPPSARRRRQLPRAGPRLSTVRVAALFRQQRHALLGGRHRVLLEDSLWGHPRNAPCRADHGTRPRRQLSHKLLFQVAQRLAEQPVPCTVVAPHWPDSDWHVALTGMCAEMRIFPPSYGFFLPGRLGGRDAVGSASWPTVVFRVEA